MAGYDLTFTPVKSVSVLWAVAPPEVAAAVEAAVEAAHDAAVARTLADLEREVLFTRRGRQGVQQVRTRGLTTAQFRHRDARSGEPNLHTHVPRRTGGTRRNPNEERGNPKPSGRFGLVTRPAEVAPAQRQLAGFLRGLGDFASAKGERAPFSASTARMVIASQLLVVSYGELRADGAATGM